MNDTLQNGSTPTSGVVIVSLASDTNSDGVVTVLGEGEWTYNAISGELSFTPEPDFRGDPTPIGYTLVEMGTGLSDTATVTVNYFNSINAISDFNNTYTNTSINGNVLTNDFDLEGDALTVVTITVISNEGVEVEIDPITGAYTYTPPTDFIGEDTFEYTVCDNGSPQACESVVVTINVLETGYNQIPPIANPDTNTTKVNIPVEGDMMVNDFDSNGDVLIINTSPISGPSNGSVVINSDGTYIYTPNANFIGEDIFEYEICDITGLCDTANVIINVLDDYVNITVANDDAYTTQINTQVTGNVLNNDNDPEGDTLTVTIVQATMNGSVTINADGTFTYIPNLDYIGPDHFIYQICDSGSPQACNSATVYFTVKGVLNECAIVFPGQDGSEFDGFGFSPNGDGINDVFQIENLQLCYPDYKIEIYNRWGNVVFDYKHNGDFNTKPIWWNGTSYGRMTMNKGEVLPAGTYFYIMHPNKEGYKSVSGYIYLTK